MADHVYSRGNVVFAPPPPTNIAGLDITQTKSGSIGRHPIIILSADASARTITGVIVQSFNNAPNLASSGLAPEHHKWFIPVVPAIKEPTIIFDPIPTRPGSKAKPEWVNIVDIVTIEVGKIHSRLDNIQETSVTAIEKAIAAPKV